MMFEVVEKTLLSELGPDVSTMLGLILDETGFEEYDVKALGESMKRKKPDFDGKVFFSIKVQIREYFFPEHHPFQFLNFRHNNKLTPHHTHSTQTSQATRSFPDSNQERSTPKSPISCL